MANKDVIDKILGEAVVGDWDDMLAIASTMVNRATRAGVSLSEVLPGYDAKGYHSSAEQHRSLAEQALEQAMVQPSTTATHYFNPNKAMPSWANAFEPAMKTKGHTFSTAPAKEPVQTASGGMRKMSAPSSQQYAGGNLIDAVSSSLGETMQPSSNFDARDPMTWPSNIPATVAPQPTAAPQARQNAPQSLDRPQGFISQALTPAQAQAAYERQYGPARPDDPNNQVMSEVRDAVGSYFGPGYSVVGISGKGEYGSKNPTWGHRQGNALDFDVVGPDGRVVDQSSMYGLIEHMVQRNPEASVGYGATYMGEGRIHYAPDGGQRWGAGIDPATGKEVYSHRFMDPALKSRVDAARTNPFSPEQLAAMSTRGTELPEAQITDVLPTPNGVRPGVPGSMPPADQPPASISPSGRYAMGQPAVDSISPAGRFSNGRNLDPSRISGLQDMVDATLGLDPSRFEMEAEPTISPSLTQPNMQSMVAGRPEFPGSMPAAPAPAVPAAQPLSAGYPSSDAWVGAMPAPKQGPLPAGVRELGIRDVIGQRGKQFAQQAAAGLPTEAQRLAEVPEAPAVSTSAGEAPEGDWSRPVDISERMGNAGWSLYNGVRPGDMLDTQDRLREIAGVQNPQGMAEAVSTALGEDARQQSVYTAPQGQAQTRSMAGQRTMAPAAIDPALAASMANRAPVMAMSPYEYANKDDAFNSVGTLPGNVPTSSPASAAIPGMDSASLAASYDNGLGFDQFGSLGDKVTQELGPMDFGLPAANPVPGVVPRQQAFNPAPTNPFTSGAVKPGDTFDLGAQLPPGTVVNGNINPKTGKVEVGSTGEYQGRHGSLIGGAIASLVDRITGIFQRDPQEAMSAFGQMIGANNPFSATGPGGMFGGNAPVSGGGTPSMGVFSRGDGTFGWGPDGGTLSPGAAAAGWASNNPERSPGGYGSGYDPTPS